VNSVMGENPCGRCRACLRPDREWALSDTGSRRQRGSGEAGDPRIRSGRDAFGVTAKSPKASAADRVAHVESHPLKEGLMVTMDESSQVISVSGKRLKPPHDQSSAARSRSRVPQGGGRSPQIELVENATHPVVFGDELLNYLRANRADLSDPSASENSREGSFRSRRRRRFRRCRRRPGAFQRVRAAEIACFTPENSTILPPRRWPGDRGGFQVNGRSSIRTSAPG
jgi:hypothetical protein